MIYYGKVTFLCFLIIFTISLGNSQAQSDNTDPLFGNYIFTKSAEMVVVSKNIEAENRQMFFDYDESGDSIFLDSEAPLPLSATSTPMEVIADDFDDDKRDEMITCEYLESPDGNGLVLTIFEVDSAETQISASRIHFIPHDFEYGQVRMASGNFDVDLARELVLAYVYQGKIKIVLYDLNETGELTEKSSVLFDNLDPALGIMARFDLTTGDINNDGRDEIIMGNIVRCLYTYNGGITNATMDINLSIYDYRESQSGLFLTKNNTLIYPYTWYNEGLDGARYLFIERFGICAGDFDADGYDEISIGFVQQTDWYDDNSILKNDNYKWFQVFLLSVDVSPDDNSLEQKPSSLPNRHTYRKDNLTNWILAKATGFSMISADLNLDGRDELMVYEGYGFKICSYNDDLELSIDLTQESDETRLILDYDGHNLIGVEKLKYDTLNQECLPHIFTLGFTVDLAGIMHYSTSPHPQGDAILSIFKPTFNPETQKCELLELIDKQNLSTSFSPGYLTNYHLAIPDFDGDGIILGPPRLISKSIVEPIVYLNSPPVHFDVFNNQAFDIGMCYNENPFRFCATYQNGVETVAAIKTEVKHDVAVSLKTEVSGGPKLFGIGFNASIKAEVGYKFNKSSAYTSTQTVKEFTNRNAASDDMILALTTDYKFWEYPVYAKNEAIGHALILNPVQAHYKWLSSDEQTRSLNFVPSHERGNILSYPEKSSELNQESLLSSPPSQTINTSPASNSENFKTPTWQLSYSDLTEELTSVTHSANSSLETSISSGFDLIGFNAELTVKAQYDYTQINTVSASIDSSFELSVFLYAIDPRYSDAEYRIQPIAYWDPNDVLILNYITETIDYPSDQAAWSWWKRHYNTLPDPTFILPWKYNVEKGYAKSAYKNFTRDIITSPIMPEPGDTVSIELCIRNFSLVGLLQPVSVKLFLGHPELDGIPITNLNGETSFSLTDNILPRSHKKMNVLWVTPMDIAPTARIYAILDQENEIDEIHENNNLAYTFIQVANATGTMGSYDGSDLTSYVPDQLSSGLNEDKLILYPNPASDVLRVKLPGDFPANKITYRIYSIEGQELASDLLHTEFQQEDHAIRLTGFNPGLYIITFASEDYINTKKFLVK